MDDTTKAIVQAALASTIRHGLTVAAGSFVTLGLVQSSDSGNFVQIGTGIVMGLIALGWSWWQKAGQKRALELLAKAKGSAVKAAIIAAFIVAASLPVTQVRAQTQTSATLTTVQQVIANVQGVLNNFLNFAGQLETTDLNLAIQLAQSQNNAAAVACWQTIEKTTVVQVPPGAGLAWFKQYYLGLAAQYVAINQNCGTVAPAYVKLYDLAIQQMQALNL